MILPVSLKESDASCHAMPLCDHVQFLGQDRLLLVWDHLSQVGICIKNYIGTHVKTGKNQIIELNKNNADAFIKFLCLATLNNTYVFFFVLFL